MCWKFVLAKLKYMHARLDDFNALLSDRIFSETALTVDWQTEKALEILSVLSFFGIANSVITHQRAPKKPTSSEKQHFCSKPKAIFKFYFMKHSRIRENAFNFQVLL